MTGKKCNSSDRQLLLQHTNMDINSFFVFVILLHSLQLLPITSFIGFIAEALTLLNS